MKTFNCIILFLFIGFLRTFAQHVNILPSGITPVMSGVYPRLTYNTILALPNPQEGDIAYDLTYHCLRVFNGNKWVNLQTQEESSPSISYLNSVNGLNSESIYGIALDDSSNIYVTGGFSSNVYLGSTKISPVSLNVLDIYIAKFDKNGTFKWVQQAGGTSAKVAYDITLDNSGNIIITGIFQGTVTFGTTSITSMGGIDIFVAKYSKNGVFQWAKSAGGAGTDYGNAIAVDANSNIYITGYFQGVATFESTSLTSAGNNDIYIAKYNSNGVLLWTQKAGGSGQDAGNDIKIDPQNNVILAGSFSTTATFGTTSLTSSGSSDIFLVKYQTDGSLSWVKKAGGSNTDDATDIELDSNGNIYVAGSYFTNAVFENTTIQSIGNGDIFIGKYLSDGTLSWVKGIGGVDLDRVYSIELDTVGSIYIAGEFKSDEFFIDTKRFIALSTSTERDFFIPKLSNDGSMNEWFKQGLNTNSLSIFQGNYINLFCNITGDIYITYSFQSTFVVGEKRYISIGNEDGFIGKIIP